MKRFASVALLFVFAWCSLAPAQAPAEAPAHALEPFLGDPTFLVARIDVHVVDAPAITEAAKEMLAKIEDDLSLRARSQAEVEARIAIASAWRDKFAAAGGKEIYVLFHVNPQYEPFVVIPLADAAKQEQMIAVMREFAGEAGNTELVARHNCILAGSPALMRGMDNFFAAERPDIIEFLNKKQQTPIEVLFAPSPGVRGLLNLAAGQVPDEFASTAITTVTRTMKTAQLSMEAGAPQLGLALTMQANSAEAAGELNDLIKAAFQRIEQEMQNGGARVDETERQLVTGMLEMLAPQLQDDQVVIALDHAQCEKVFEMLLEPLKAARAAAREVQSMANVRFWCMAVMNCAIDNRGRMPASYEQLVPYLGDGATFVSPASGKTVPAEFHEWDAKAKGKWLQEHSSYAVVFFPDKRIDEIDVPSETVVIIEKLTPGAESIGLGFFDGHVARMPVEQAKKLISERTGKTLEQWSASPSPGA